jgi:hypothetical protein
MMMEYIGIFSLFYRYISHMKLTLHLFHCYLL